MTRHFISLCTLTLASTMLSALVIAAPINVVYVNGIQNTLEEAKDTAVKMQSILSNSPNHIGNNKRIFAVTPVWNPIGWYGNSNFALSQDLQELFLLKTSEEKYAADFGLILAPHNQARIIDKAAAARVAAYIDDMTPGYNSLEASGAISDKAMESTQFAVRNVIAVVQRLKSAVIVGHSEGNILANLAFASIAATQGNDIYKSVRVVNVANTSEFAVSGLNFTHAGDAALFSAATSKSFIDQSLETLPTRRNWTRTTPACRDNGACKFTITPATFAVPTSAILDQGFVDKRLNHSIVETYLTTATVPVIDSQGVSLSSTAIGFVDRFEDFIYAAVLSLETSQGSTAGATVQSASCTSPVVGTVMTCTIAGSNLPADVSMTATNCSPSNMAIVAGGTVSMRQFSCMPETLNLPVSVTYKIPGIIGTPIAIPVLLAGMSATFYDTFDGDTLDPTKWNFHPNPTYGGSYAIIGSEVTFNKSWADTLNKVTFTGSKIVIEARIAGKDRLRDTTFYLYDVANSSNLISAHDTNYNGWGLTIQTTGAFGAINETNNLSFSSYKVIRLTIEGNQISLERGDSSGMMTEGIQRTMSTSIVGKSFYLLIGTGAPDYTPGSFDWISVTTY